jgi:hypothetical protein
LAGALLAAMDAYGRLHPKVPASIDATVQLLLSTRHDFNNAHEKFQ